MIWWLFGICLYAGVGLLMWVARGKGRWWTWALVGGLVLLIDAAIWVLEKD